MRSPSMTYRTLQREKSQLANTGRLLSAGAEQDLVWSARGQFMKIGLCHASRLAFKWQEQMRNTNMGDSIKRLYSR